MTYRDESRGLPLEIHTTNCRLGRAHRDSIEQDFRRVRKLVDQFPVSGLHLRVQRNPRTGRFHVKANLRLPKRNLFTGERGTDAVSCCEACARQLAEKVQAYKDRLSRKPLWRRGRDRVRLQAV